MITEKFRKNGKIEFIHTGAYPNIKVFFRVEINGEDYFKCYNYGKTNLYQPKAGFMVFVGKTDEEGNLL